MLIEVVTKTHGPGLHRPITTKVGRVIAASPQPMSSRCRRNQRRVRILGQQARDARSISCVGATRVGAEGAPLKPQA
jgi:hypothetical protein